LEIGLEVNEVSGERRFYVENNSLHIIKDVEVKVEQADERIKVDGVEILDPGERAYLEYFPPTTSKTIEIILEAPFHLPLKRSFEVPQAGIEFEHKLKFPDVGFVGKFYSLTLTLCNKSIDLNNITVTESHSEAYFLERGKIDVLDLQEGDCENLVYNLTPTQIGSTTIYFNVKVQHFNELFEKEIEHSVEVRE